MEWYEAAFDRMYPVVYKHRDIDEACRVINTYKDVFRGKEPILDLACGAGRYLESLSRLGYTAYGLDLSHYLLKACVDRWGHGDRIVQADMRRLPFSDACMGAVINMFSSFGYFSRDTDNILVFQEILRVLMPGGVFLFDFINAEKLMAELLSETTREENNYYILEKRRLDDHGKYLVKEIDITNLLDNEKTHLVEHLRLYRKKDLLEMFSSLGFEISDVFGDYTGHPFLEGVSDRVIVLAAKRRS